MYNARPRRAAGAMLASAAALVVSSLAVTRPAAAQTTATWVNPVSGVWDNSTLWSTNPVAPNNGSPTPADTYNAVIGATGGNYVVTLGSTIALNGLTLGSPGATLSQSGWLTLNSF